MKTKEKKPKAGESWQVEKLRCIVLHVTNDGWVTYRIKNLMPVVAPIEFFLRNYRKSED